MPGLGNGGVERVQEYEEVGVWRGCPELPKKAGCLAAMKGGVNDEVLNHVAQGVRPGLIAEVAIRDDAVSTRRR
jgi:hypothetical protein